MIKRLFLGEEGDLFAVLFGVFMLLKMEKQKAPPEGSAFSKD
ncbi:hypothetical protein PTW35_13725 [Photobacterium sp. DA100]|nr:hypothetical protein [Photobacterium sp. DA100]WEM41667.1 hypothetical protein PTW35_13725 [Photobacterium sp. DA100]